MNIDNIKIIDGIIHCTDIDNESHQINANSIRSIIGRDGDTYDNTTYCHLIEIVDDEREYIINSSCADFINEVYKDGK